MAESQALFTQHNLEKLATASQEHSFLNWAAFCAVLEFEPESSTDVDYFKFLFLMTRELGEDAPVWKSPSKGKRAGQRQEHAWMIAGFGFAYVIHLFWMNSGPGVSGFLQVENVQSNSKTGQTWRKRFKSLESKRKKRASKKKKAPEEQLTLL